MKMKLSEKPPYQEHKQVSFSKFRHMATFTLIKFKKGGDYFSMKNKKCNFEAELT